MSQTHTTCQTFASDTALSVLGVPGRLTHQTTMPGKPVECWFKQRWISERRPISGYSAGAYMVVSARYDDECGNRNNTFSITATVWNPRRKDDCEACGCLHEEISAVFPELAPLIGWHLVSADGPMHYVANTVFHAKQGKLDYARSTAVWPDMPEELAADPEALKAALMERLPALLKRFRVAVEGVGFKWSPEDAQ